MGGICGQCKYKRLIEDGEDIEDVKNVARYKGFRNCADTFARELGLQEGLEAYKLIKQIKMKIGEEK